MFKRFIIIGVLFWTTIACSAPYNNLLAPAAAEESTAQPSADPPTPVPPTGTPHPATETPHPPAADAPAAYGPKDFPPQVDPLTGQQVSDLTRLERRPVAVRVQMFPRGSRPPWGISLADVVYDFYQNNGVTRLHAIFHSQDAETVGPIRSARLLDIDSVHMYQSSSPSALLESRTFQRLYNNDFASRPVIEGNAKCPPMCRTDPNGYNYLVSNTAELSNYITAQGRQLTPEAGGMSFAELTPAAASQATGCMYAIPLLLIPAGIMIPPTIFFWRFQDTREAPDYQSEGYEALTDRLTNAQVSASNVVVIFAPHKLAFGTSSGAGEVYDISLEGQGKAYAFRDAQMFEVVWNHPEKNSVLFLTFPDGTPYAFKPGNTWYHVIGKSSKAETTSDNAWRFTLAVP
jgi:hypothetical protein